MQVLAFMKRKLEFPCSSQKSSRNSGRTRQLFKGFSNQELWNFRNVIRWPRKEPLWQGECGHLRHWQWASLLIPFSLPELASLLPASIGQDLKSAQQRQQHKTDGHCPGKTHTCHSTSWQTAKLQEKKGLWMSKVEVSARSTWLSSCNVIRDFLPTD